MKTLRELKKFAKVELDVPKIKNASAIWGITQMKIIHNWGFYMSVSSIISESNRKNSCSFS